MTQQNNAPEEQPRNTAETETAAPVVAEAEAVLEQAATAETEAIMALRFSEEDAAKAGELSAAMHALFAKYNAPLIVYGLVPVDLEGFRVIKGIVVVKEAEKLLDSSGHHGAFMYAAARSISMIDELEDDGPCDCPNCKAARSVAEAAQAAESKPEGTTEG